MWNRTRGWRTYDKAGLLDILREFGILRQEPVTFRTISAIFLA